MRAFHANGTKNSISNLWEVDDKSSNQLLFVFYKNIENGKNSLDALRTCKLKILHQSTNLQSAAPYFWAEHKFIGGAIVFDGEKNSFNSTIYYSIILFVLLVIFLCKRKKFKNLQL